MGYIAFREAVRSALGEAPAPLTRRDLRAAEPLSYERPGPIWVARLEHEIGRRREPGPSRATLWSLSPSSQTSEAG